MAEENISQEFRLQMTDETRNCIIDKIKQNELVSKKLKKVYIALTLIRLGFLRVVFSWRGVVNLTLLHISRRTNLVLI